MVTNKLGSFAAGLLVATTICATAYLFEPKEATSVESSAIASVSEMKKVLSSAGYVIKTEEEWNEHKQALETAETQSAELQKTEEETVEKEEEVVYKTILNVASGMTSIDVGRVLVQANITDSAMTFVNEVEKRGKANDLRPGTYEINSNMTIDDIILLVFK